MISGYGKMGRMVEKTLAEMGIECAGKSENIRSFDPAVAKDAVCIDFTVPAAIRENYKFLAENFKAVVIGTTGWNDIRDEVVSYFIQCGTPMVYASNFSIGVNINDEWGPLERVDFTTPASPANVAPAATSPEPAGSLPARVVRHTTDGKAFLHTMVRAKTLNPTATGLHLTGD